MASGTEPHTVVTKTNNLKCAQWENLFVCSGWFTGNGTSSINLQLPITIAPNFIIPCLIRDATTGALSTYFINASGEIVGWDGTSNRIFVDGRNYWLSFSYVI